MGHHRTVLQLDFVSQLWSKTSKAARQDPQMERNPGSYCPPLPPLTSGWSPFTWITGQPTILLMSVQ